MKKGINEVRIRAYEWVLFSSQMHEKAPLCRFYHLSSHFFFIPGFLAFLEILSFLLDFSRLHECKSLLFIRTISLIVNHMHKYFLLIAMYINKGEHNIDQSTISTFKGKVRNP